MERKVKSEVASEFTLPAIIVDSTSNAFHLKESRKEFSLFEPNLHGGLVECAVETVCTSKNLKLKLEQKVKAEVISEVSLSANLQSSSEALYLNEIKKEFLPEESNPCCGFVEDDVDNYYTQTKSDAVDLKFDVQSGNDDIYMKLEPVVSEELHIKHDIDQSPADQTIRCIQVNNYLEVHIMETHPEKKHLNTHTTDKLFQCQICDFICIRKDYLERHIMKTHRGEKPFRCNICYTTFSVKRSLQQHIRIHMGDKPFKCKICDTKFTVKSSLQQHMRTHTEEKPLNCSVCGLSFSRKDILKLHMTKHTVEIPLYCNICDTKVAEEKNLRQHMKTHTRGKTLQVRCM